MIQLKQMDGVLITPKDDALLYDFLLNGKSGIFEGCEVTHLGANQLRIANGRGVVCGRIFSVEEETILAELSTSGSQNGRLMIRVDISNTETPISFVTQVGALPALTQEDINRDGTVFELPIITYTATELLVENLTPVAPAVINTPAPHTHAGTEVKLTGYTKPASTSALTSADSVNAALGKLEAGQPVRLTHTKSGTTHTLTGLPTADGVYTGQFVATADYTEGDTFAGGWIAKPNGEEEALPDKAFVAGDVVSVAIYVSGSTKKLGFKLGGGVNKTLPPQIRNFAATGGDAKVHLSWMLPEDVTDYAGLRIVYKAGSSPTGVNDGTKIEKNNTATTHEVTGLTNGTIYYFRAFPYNAKGQFQTVPSLANAQAGTILLSSLPLMSKVRVTIGGINWTMLVVSQGKPGAMYDDSCSGTWLLMEHIYTELQWDSSNLNAYATSTLDAWFNDTFYNSLPAGFKAQIKTASIPYTPGNGNTTLSSISRKVFAVSATELGQTHQYLNAEGTALANAADLKIATNSSGTAKTQWTRSPYTNNTTYAWSLGNDGSRYNYICASTFGTRPACVLDSGTALNFTPNADGSYNLA